MIARPRLAAQAALAALAAVVLSLHLLALDRLWRTQLGEGAAAQGPPRIEVAFVTELRPAAPPAPVPVAARPRRAMVAPAPVAPAPAASAASAPPEAAPDDATAMAAPAPVEPAASAASSPPTDPTPAVAAASAPAVVAEAMPGPATAEPAPAAASAPVAEPFEWPRSTRLTYSVTGNYRGPVHGRARVEWLREGPRYQVHLEVSVGPPFAPLMSRRMSSDGTIGDAGLQPRRYDEETRALLRDPRRLSIEFLDDQVQLPQGQQLPRPPGVQDTASQFVQLTWLFRTRPQLLQAGQTVAVPLALPRHVSLWVYDVLGAETVHTPVGALDAVHVRPRRPASARNDLTAEMWVAPTLQYLPVRFVIRQDEETFVDLLLDRLPQQAAESAPGR